VIDFSKLKVGDYVRIEYTSGESFKGGTISGEITKLWNGEKEILQGQVNNGWCFHVEDKLLEYNPLTITRV
jgi:hypothetical protein